MISFTPRPSYRRGKSPQYPLDKTLGESQQMRWEEKQFLYLPGIEPVA